MTRSGVSLDLTTMTGVRGGSLLGPVVLEPEPDESLPTACGVEPVGSSSVADSDSRTLSAVISGCGMLGCACVWVVDVVNVVEAVRVVETVPAPPSDDAVFMGLGATLLFFLRGENSLLGVVCSEKLSPRESTSSRMSVGRW